jgi:hypothetical protein
VFILEKRQQTKRATRDKRRHREKETMKRIWFGWLALALAVLCVCVHGTEQERGMFAQE